MHWFGASGFSFCQLLFPVLYLTFASSVPPLTASSLQHESPQAGAFLHVPALLCLGWQLCRGAVVAPQRLAPPL